MLRLGWYDDFENIDNNDYRNIKRGRDWNNYTGIKYYIFTLIWILKNGKNWHNKTKMWKAIKNEYCKKIINK